MMAARAGRRLTAQDGNNCTNNDFLNRADRPKETRSNHGWDKALRSVPDWAGGRTQVHAPQPPPRVGA